MPVLTEMSNAHTQKGESLSRQNSQWAFLRFLRPQRTRTCVLSRLRTFSFSPSGRVRRQTCSCRCHDSNMKRITLVTSRLSSRGMLRNRREFSTVLHPYEPPPWASHLKGCPRSTVQLGITPTPIHEWKMPGIAESFQLYIKRDDMTGSSLSGNKVRKLEFLMADALAHGCSHVITCGAVQSNHCRAVAVSARQLGLEPHLVLRCPNGKMSLEEARKGNMLLNRMCGAHLYDMPLTARYETHLKPMMEKIASKISSATGEKSYLIPVGGSDRVGVFGYIKMFQELIDQSALERFDDIVFACGSGGTAAGLAIANYLTGSQLRIHGVAVSDDEQYFLGHVDEMLTELGLKKLNSRDLLSIIEGYKGQRYGYFNTEDINRMVAVSRSTGVFLDPVYTGKAVNGLVTELNQTPSRFKGSRILFLHTGGIHSLSEWGEWINRCC